MSRSALTPNAPTPDAPPTLGPSPRRAAALELLAGGIIDGSSPTRIPVSGQCMEPLILDGDQISVVPLDGPPRLGEVVLAQTDLGALVCHRVLQHEAGGHTLGGDRTMRLDHHAPDSILGRVVAVHRGSRVLSMPRAGIIDRLQARLHLRARQHRQAPWFRLFEWPRRLLIELRGRRWWLAQ